MIHRSIRQDELCLGPLDCNDAKEAECIECSATWECADTNVPGNCPDCDSKQAKINRCEHCPLRQLDEMRRNSHAGVLLDRILDLEFSIEHFKLGWEDVTAEEVKALQILTEERSKYQQEQREKEEQERQHQAALQR